MSEISYEVSLCIRAWIYSEFRTRWGVFSSFCVYVSFHAFVDFCYICLLITDTNVWICVCVVNSNQNRTLLSISGTFYQYPKSHVTDNSCCFVFCNYKANLSCFRRFFCCYSSNKCSSSPYLICASAIAILLGAFKCAQSKWASRKQFSAHTVGVFAIHSRSKVMINVVIFDLRHSFAVLIYGNWKLWRRTENKNWNHINSTNS